LTVARPMPVALPVTNARRPVSLREPLMLTLGENRIGGCDPSFQPRPDQNSIA
jgi:hypothetical protein